MPRKKLPTNRPRGTQPKFIDWDLVDTLAIKGCLGSEIASRLGICADTLYNRCLTDKGVLWSEYLRQKHEIGETLLRAKQFDKAIGKCKDGDNTLLIWLGKQRLGQRESLEQAPISEEINKKLDQHMSFMKDRQTKSSEEALKQNIDQHLSQG